jgi:hypothetical protein
MRLLLRIVAMTLLALTIGCQKDSAGPLDKIAAKAGSPTGRSDMAADIVAGFRAKKFGIGNAIDAAHKRLESAAAGSSGSSPDAAASRAATEFAGAVLDATRQLESTLPTGGEHEIFWMQVGRLAFRASEEAFANQRVSEARSLVFGGGERWQNEPYWTRYSDHDGLASAILAAEGERSEAISRLQNRPNLSGVALEVFEKLTGR